MPRWVGLAIATPELPTKEELVAHLKGNKYDHDAVWIVGDLDVQKWHQVILGIPENADAADKDGSSC